LRIDIENLCFADKCSCCRINFIGILMSYVQGTSSDQDNRFSDKNKRLMKTMKFADAIAKKVMCMILFANITR